MTRRSARRVNPSLASEKYAHVGRPIRLTGRGPGCFSPRILAGRWAASHVAVAEVGEEEYGWKPYPRSLLLIVRDSVEEVAGRSELW